MLRSRLAGSLVAFILAGSPSLAADPAPAGRVIFLSRCEVEYVRSSQIGVAAMETTATILQELHPPCGHIEMKRYGNAAAQFADALATSF